MLRSAAELEEQEQTSFAQSVALGKAVHLLAHHFACHSQGRKGFGGVALAWIAERLSAQPFAEAAVVEKTVRADDQVASWGALSAGPRLGGIHSEVLHYYPLQRVGQT